MAQALPIVRDPIKSPSKRQLLDLLDSIGRAGALLGLHTFSISIESSSSDRHTWAAIRGCPQMIDPGPPDEGATYPQHKEGAFSDPRMLRGPGPIQPIVFPRSTLQGNRSRLATVHLHDAVDELHEKIEEQARSFADEQSMLLIQRDYFQNQSEAFQEINASAEESIQDLHQQLRSLRVQKAKTSSRVQKAKTSSAWRAESACIDPATQECREHQKTLLEEKLRALQSTSYLQSATIRELRTQQTNTLKRAIPRDTCQATMENYDHQQQGLHDRVLHLTTENGRLQRRVKQLETEMAGHREERERFECHQSQDRRLCDELRDQVVELENGRDCDRSCFEVAIAGCICGSAQLPM